MVRNVSKEDISKLNGLLNQTLDEETVDYELSMLDEEDGEILSAFVVEKYRVPYEIGAEDDDEYEYHEILGVYIKDGNDESFEHSFYESCVATDMLVLFWVPWTEEYEKILTPTFVDYTENNTRHLFTITYTKEKSKYKAN